MTVWTDIAHHNKNVISVKTTMKITSVAKNIQATTFSLKFFFHSWTKNGKIYPKILYNEEYGWQIKIMSFNWGRFTSIHAIFVAWMLSSQGHERNIVSFVLNLLNSLAIVVYVRKNVIAFYGPIFASCTSVPHLKKMSSRFKTCFKTLRQSMNGKSS